MNKQQVLDTIAAWLDHAADPDNHESQLTIERVGFIKDGATGGISGAQFLIKNVAIVGGFAVANPNASKLVQPSGGIYTPGTK